MGAPESVAAESPPFNRKPQNRTNRSSIMTSGSISGTRPDRSQGNSPHMRTGPRLYDRARAPSRDREKEETRWPDRQRWACARRCSGWRKHCERRLTGNPSLRTFVAGGCDDLATPSFAADFTIQHLGLDPSLRGNVTVRYGEAGHMMYIHRPSAIRLK